MFAAVQDLSVQPGPGLEPGCALGGQHLPGARLHPGHKPKSGTLERVGTILYTAGEALRLVSVLLFPVMPAKMAELWNALGWQVPKDLRQALTWGQLRAGAQINPVEPLFPRIQLEVEPASAG